MPELQSKPLQSTRFLLLYALAAAGGATAYVPFLTILLPMRLANLAGADDVQWLAYIAFAGAIAASLGNILFGWLSDLTKHRRAWIACGLILSCLLLLCFSWAERFEVLVGLILLWQLALNMMLAPLGAWAGDNVPDEQKGLLGGLLAFSPALGALSTAIVTIPGLAGEDSRLWIVAGLVTVSVLPALIFGAPKQFPELLPQSDRPAQRTKMDSLSRQMVVRMWVARLLVQISEAALFAYLFFWFRSIEPTLGDSTTARIFTLAIVIAIPVALITGRWADRNHRPILPLTICAGFTSIGLIVMALSSTPLPAIGGYLLFGLATTVFLSLHTGQTLRILPKPETRGRDLGLFNLTNTTPSLIMPWIVLALVPVFGFPILLGALAFLTLIACVFLATFPDFRPPSD